MKKDKLSREGLSDELKWAFKTYLDCQAEGVGGFSKELAKQAYSQIKARLQPVPEEKMKNKYYMITGFDSYETHFYEYDTLQDLLVDYQQFGKYSADIKLIKGCELKLCFIEEAT